MNKYSSLFSPLKVGRATLKNRVVMSPMTTRFCTTAGDINDVFIQYYIARARGGAGLLITDGITPDSSFGRPLTRTNVDTEFNITRYHELADGVHAYGAKVMVQLEVEGLDYSQDPIAQAVERNRAWTKDQLHSIIESYARASSYLQMAGIDGVQIEAAGGYFLNQFLSPLTNYRTDEYSGDTKGRAKLLTNAIAAVRETCGPDFLIDVRLPVIDYVEGGITLEEGIEFAKLCEQAGADMLNIYGGFTFADDCFEIEAREDGARVWLTSAIRPHVGIPVSVNGKIKTAALADKIIESGEADLINIGRPFLADPDWAVKHARGKEQEIRPCLSCNECIDHVVSYMGPVKCSVNPFLGSEWRYDEHNMAKAGTSKNVVVVEAGAAGLQAAYICALRGHRVTVIEKEQTAGGQMLLATVPPHKEAIGRAAAWIAKKAADAGVVFVMGTEATEENVTALKPDVVLLCTGAEPNSLPVQGCENALQAWDILSGKIEIPQGQSVVIGGGQTGLEAAAYIVAEGGKSVVLEMRNELAVGMESFHKAVLPEILAQDGVESITSAKVKKITPDSVTYEKDGKELTIESVLTVVAAGQHPKNTGLYDALLQTGVEVYCIGDALKDGKIKDATNTAFTIACRL